jgi:hypothetical protein
MSKRELLGFAAGVAAVVVAVFASEATAFGIAPPERGVGREHERITRAAVTGMDKATLDQLAGAGEEPGAVGAPDAFGTGATAHCEGGDFLDESYPQTEAEAQVALTACRTLIVGELEAAVAAAKPLATATAEDVALDCDFESGGGSTKCKVLLHLGRALHAAQDFYAHTNWVDKPAAGPVSAANPPGLGKKGRSLWLDPRTQVPFPEGLMSGCSSQDDLPLNTCDYGTWMPGLGLERVRRATLGKDSGPIGRGGSTGQGLTARGAINDNFRNAVAAAVEDTRDKVEYFKERVLATYGAEGEAILCAFAHDKLDQSACVQTASRSSVCIARRAFYVDEEKSVVPAAPSAEERSEAEKVAEGLRNSCRLEEAELTREAVINGGKADEGRVYAQTRAAELLALWNACPADGRAYLDLSGPEHKEALLARPAKPVSPALRKRRELLGAVYADCVLDARLRELGK